MTFEDALKSHAKSLGFALVGIAAAGPADDFDYLLDWLDDGFAGSMGYMQRRAQERRHPNSILPDVQSVVMVGWEYGAPAEPVPPPAMPPSHGKISRYAHGPDYHDVLRSKLKELLAWVQEQRPEIRGRAVVDTAPLLERDFARRAGLGWIGKNTMLINKHRGSYFLLGGLLLDLALTADAPHTGFHCGTCTRCLDACPTDAFAAPGRLDARKCISYLTIELREPMPEELRPHVGDWLFGCDICQEVCPWNRKNRSQPETVDAIALLGLSDSSFRARYGGTALERTRRRGLARNAAVVLGNSADKTALPALWQALEHDDEMVREAAAWAIERIEDRHAGG